MPLEAYTMYDWGTALGDLAWNAMALVGAYHAVGKPAARLAVRLEKWAVAWEVSLAKKKEKVAVQNPTEEDLETTEEDLERTAEVLNTARWYLVVQGVKGLGDVRVRTQEGKMVLKAKYSTGEEHLLKRGDVLKMCPGKWLSLDMSTYPPMEEGHVWCAVFSHGLKPGSTFMVKNGNLLDLRDNKPVIDGESCAAL
jgi:hypothetical protein